jgi:hypothetical protein
MKIFTVPLVLFSSLFLILPNSFIEKSLADDEVPPNKSTKIEEIPKQLPSAISISLIDGVIKYINNDRRAKFKLQWSPLKVSDSLINQAGTQDFSVIKLRINSRDLENGNWINNLNPTDKKEVLKALNVSSLATLISSVDSSLDSGTVTVSEYMHMSRERNILKFLIKSQGVKYSFGLKAQEAEILSPDYSDENVVWHIDIYKLTSRRGGEYYRFTAKAVVDSLELRIPNDVISIDKNDKNKTKKIFYDVRFKLKKNQPGSVTEIFKIPATSFDIPEPNSEFKNKENSLNADLQKSLLSLNGFLSIFGGSEKLGDAVLGLLSGTDNTSIVGGGLVNFNEGGVAPFIGVNQEIGKIGDNFTSGVLFGVGTGDKTSLYIGPSVQYSVFTISAGARLGTQVNSDVSFAGMVAVDLSRLTNGKRDPAPTPVDISNTGGNFGNQYDAIISSYTLLEYTSKVDIELTQVCDVSRKTTSSDSEKIKIALPKSDSAKKIYLPRGIYEYDVDLNKIRIDASQDKVNKLGPLDAIKKQVNPITCYPKI